MISRKPFQFRRVIAMHGLLLVAVLAVAFFSGRAQYDALHSQRLAEVQSQQQNSARASAQALQQAIRLCIASARSLERLPENLLPPGWQVAAGTVDANGNLRAMGDESDADKLRDVVAEDPQLMNVDRPTLRPREDGSELLLIVPRPEQKDVFIGSLSPQTLIGTPLAAGNRSETILAIDAKSLFASGSTRLNDNALKLLAEDTKAGKAVAELLDANTAGTVLVGEQASDGPSLITVQPVDLLSGTRGYLVMWRPDEGAAISQAIAPLVWQLVGGAGLMVAAVAIVLSSTTLSLVRGRQRIEALRLAMLKNDLQKARTIQLKWLPAPDLKNDCIEIAAENEPAAHISGDFYNWFELPAQPGDACHRTAMVIGDVSGHGMPAAFLMATTQLIVRNTLPSLRDPGACLTEVNKQLCSMVYNGQFVTMMILVLDHDNGKLIIASAGQSPPLLKRDGRVKPIDVDPDLVVGVDETTVYESHEAELQPGDGLLMYTDGVIETASESSEQFSLTRLSETYAAAGEDPREVTDAVVAAVAQHRGEYDPEDDLTLVAIRLLTVDASRRPSDAAMAI